MMHKYNMDRKKILHTLKDFKENNADKYGILTLGIFGSVAKNSSQPDSDIEFERRIRKTFWYSH